MTDRNIVAQLVLVLVTFFWGSTFLTLQIALRWADPIVIVAMRFALASFIIFCLLKGRVDQITRYEWKAGFFVGCAIFGVYTLQTIGLQSIPSSTSAFLSGLYVAFVPLFQWLVFKVIPSTSMIITVILAFIGMTLFANPFAVSFTGQTGEWITVVSAAICAAEILTISHFAKGCRPLPLSFTQLVTVAALALITLLFHTPVRPTELTPGLILCVSMLAAIVGFVQFGIGWALKYVSAIRATLIYALEPVFAGIIGWLAGERLGLSELTCAALIVGAVLLTAWKPTKRNLKKDSGDVA